MPFASPLEAFAAIRRVSADRGDCAGLAVSTEAVAAFPESGEVWAWHCSCLMDRGRVEEAQEALTKALELAPGSATVAGAAIKMRLYAGEFDDASEYVERAASGTPLDVLGAGQAADFYAVTGREECLGLHEQLLRENENDPNAWFHAVIGLMGLDQALKATEHHEEMKRRFPDHGRTLRLEARFANKRQDLQSAAILLEKLVQMMPESDLAWAELAQSHRWAGRADEARAAAENSLELNPRSSVACSVMAKLAEAAGNPSEAAMWFQRQQEAVPGLKQILPLAQANALSQKGQWKQAAAVLQPVLSAPMASTRRTAARMCAGALRHAKDWAGLEKVIAILDKEGDRTPDYYIANAALQQAKKNTNAAVDWYVAGIELWPRDGVLRALHLLALDSVGKATEAHAAAKEALENLPPSPSGCMEILMALDHAKLCDEYLAMLAKAKEAFPDRQEWRMCDALLAMENGDFDKAQGLAETLDDTYADTREMIRKSARMFGGLKGFFDRFKGGKK